MYFRYMKENFIIKIETYHIADRGHQENVHELTPAQLKQREVIHMDIANDAVSSGDYKSDEDPKLYKSAKTGRGPLNSPKWKDEVDPVMTCYKLVTMEFKWFGLQSKVESFISSTERRLFLNLHRQVFCWTDKWHGMTIQDIRALEEKTKEELEQQRKTGEVRGTKAT